MPHTDLLPTRLQDGALAVALADRDVFANPTAPQPLQPGVAEGDLLTIVDGPIINAEQRWWRVKKAGANGSAWMVECDHDQYYLKPEQDAGEGEPVIEPVIYIVEPGDSWYKIAAKFNTTFQALMAANPDLIRPGNELRPGDRVVIPGEGEPVIHVVQLGDSWYGIAATYQTTFEALKEANPTLIRLDNELRPGDRMVIPG